MNQIPIRAVEMVRTIRDAIYEETKHLSREELKGFFAREAAAMREESQQSRPSGESAQPAPASDARARR
jgi:hypothetical protein